MEGDHLRTNNCGAPVCAVPPELGSDIQLLAMECSSCGIAIADARRPDMPLVYVNAAFTRITGYEREEVLGRNCRFLQGRDRDQAGRHEIRAALAQGRACQVTLINYRKDGRRFYNELNIAPVRDASGALTHFIGVQTDVTARVEARQRQEQWASVLMTSNQQLERALLASEEFFSHVSHELRTPLNAILGFAELMDLPPEGPGGEGRARPIDQIRLSGRHLRDLIDDLLDFSKAESGRLEVEYAACEVETLVGEVSGMMTTLAEARGVSLETRIGGVYGRFMGDARKLRQILLNLLSNAVKFTPAGGRATLEVAAPAPDWLEFAVSDTGIGILAENQSRMFERFFREGRDDGASRGTGIGLALCRRLVDLMGGTIGFTSRPGEGSRFWFRLPVVAAPPDEPAPNADPQSDPATEGERMEKSEAHILVADDDAANRLLLQEILEMVGYLVTICADGQEAVDAFERVRPDLVLLDLNMPRLNGTEAMRQIRARGGRVPVIVLSGDSGGETGTLRVAQGFDASLDKPIEMNALIEAVRMHLKR